MRVFYCEYNKVPGQPTAIFDCVIGSGSYFKNCLFFLKNIGEITKDSWVFFWK